MCLFDYGKLIQNRVPKQIHDLINIVHVGDQAQADIVLGDVAQGSLGAGIGNTELQGVVQQDVHVEVAAVPALIHQVLGSIICYIIS